MTSPEDLTAVPFITIGAEITINGTVHCSAVTTTAASYDALPGLREPLQRGALHALYTQLVDLGIASHHGHPNDIAESVTYTEHRHTMDLSNDEDTP